MATTLLQLRTELYARGYDYLSPARANWFINAAYSELAATHPWYWLEATTTQAAPVNLSDVGRIVSVNDSADNRHLAYVDRSQLVGDGLDLTTAGTASSWYWDGNTVNVYPTTGNTVTIHYIKAPSLLVSDSDTIDLPEQYRDVVIDGAVIRALKDSDNYAEVAALRQEWDRQVQTLYMMQRQYEPRFIQVTNIHDWA